MKNNAPITEIKTGGKMTTKTILAAASVLTMMLLAPGMALADEATQQIADIMDAANEQLEQRGSNMRAGVAELLVASDGDAVGITVFSKAVGNKQLATDFVPFDPRRFETSGPFTGTNDNITYAVDQTDAVPPMGGLDASQTTAAIDSAMATWDNVRCSKLSLTKNPDYGVDIGVLAFLRTGGARGSFAFLADIQHAGFTDLDFPPGVLGVTITFLFTDAPDHIGPGNPTDIDNNGKWDVGLREIYYDPSWNWHDDGVASPGAPDVEAVALHEAGHGLSQGHFGQVFSVNGTRKAAPLARMNAIYSGPIRTLAGSDKGGHCSNWGSWPNN